MPEMWWGRTYYVKGGIIMRCPYCEYKIIGTVGEMIDLMKSHLKNNHLNDVIDNALECLISLKYDLFDLPESG